MGNCIGYMDGYVPTREDKEKELLTALQDRKFDGKQNHFIKVEISRLFDVCEVGKKDGSDAASKLLEEIYADNGYEIMGKDNWFCYALGDKITIFMGGKPKPQYNE